MSNNKDIKEIIDEISEELLKTIEKYYKQKRVKVVAKLNKEE